MKKLYVDTGFKENGHKILAFKNCNDCGGKGFTKDIVHKTLIACKCIKTIALPVSWVIL